jgi:hypothetical protein
MPKKPDADRVMSKKATIRAVRKALLLESFRAELITNRFCIPIGAR